MIYYEFFYKNKLKNFNTNLNYHLKYEILSNDYKYFASY